MSEQNKSAGEQFIETLMQQLDPSSERYKILATARQFKSSWISLGEELQRVRRELMFTEWGYESFEDYCRHEIRIRKQTADKLTHAFGFLERHAPDVLRQPKAQPLPDYRSVDFLRRATEDGGFPPEELDALRNAVLTEHRPLPTVRDRFNNVVRNREQPNETLLRQLQAALSAARRLENALAPFPEERETIGAELSSLTGDLERQLAELQDEPTPDAATDQSEDVASQN
ncbi:MAG: hypothetical protein C0616_10610 [Desulfuromonas sp.]|nr:MAG: hypothetical protein C0616_10610 [Desulfuromonas sp.]